MIPTPTTFVPKHAVCEGLCESCPFRKDRGILQGTRGEKTGFRGICTEVEMGFPFFCHVTVYKTPSDLLTKGDSAPKHPSCNWKLCAGGIRHKEEWNLAMRARYAAKAAKQNSQKKTKKTKTA